MDKRIREKLENFEKIAWVSIQNSRKIAWAPAREKLENFGKIAWVQILLVSSLSLLVSFCNYHL